MASNITQGSYAHQLTKFLPSFFPFYAYVIIMHRATSISMIEKMEKWEQVPCIWYTVTFKDQTEALLDSKSEVNIISQVFAYQLGLKICKTNVGV